MRTDPNIPDPDGFYAALVAAHEGLSDAQSAALNARLVFLLANQIGDQGVLLACVDAARFDPAGGEVESLPSQF
jgi:hypothetical protein